MLDLPIKSARSAPAAGGRRSGCRHMQRTSGTRIVVVCMRTGITHSGIPMDRRRFIVAAATLASGMAATRGAAARIVEDRAAGAQGRSPGRETGVAAFAAERRFAVLPQGRIAYVDRGSGPGALFLHGFPLNGYQWRGALDRLSAHRRCIVPDLMGLGYSEPGPGQDLRAPAQARMVIALLDRLGVTRVDLVANDSGCAIAQLLMARHPSRIRSVLLTNGDTEPDCPPQAVLSVVAAAKAGTFAGWFGPCLEDKDRCRRPGQLGGDTFTFPERLRDDTIDMYLAPLAAHPARTNAYGRAAEGNPLAGISAALRRLDAPVRIVWGTGDTIFKAETPDYLDKLFPNSRGVLRVPGAKLFFPEEFPDLIAGGCAGSRASACDPRCGRPSGRADGWIAGHRSARTWPVRISNRRGRRCSRDASCRTSAQPRISFVHLQASARGSSRREARHFRWRSDAPDPCRCILVLVSGSRARRGPRASHTAHAARPHPAVGKEHRPGNFGDGGEAGLPGTARARPGWRRQPVRAAGRQQLRRAARYHPARSGVRSGHEGGPAGAQGRARIAHVRLPVRGARRGVRATQAAALRGHALLHRARWCETGLAVVRVRSCAAVEQYVLHRLRRRLRTRPVRSSQCRRLPGDARAPQRRARAVVDLAG